MPDSASVVRRTHTQDADGNDVVTVATLGPYPCRLEAVVRLPLEQAQGGQMVAVTLWHAYLPFGTDVRPDDTLLINGRIYEVTDQTGERTDAVNTLVVLKRVK